MWQLNPELENKNIEKLCGLIGRKTITRMTGLKRGTVNWLIEQGVLIPLLIKKNKKCITRLFSPGCVMIIEKYMRLRQAGRSLKSIKRQLENETTAPKTIESSP